MKFGRNIQNTLEQSLYASVFMQVCLLSELYCFKVKTFFETQCTVDRLLPIIRTINLSLINHFWNRTKSCGLFAIYGRIALREISECNKTCRQS